MPDDHLVRKIDASQFFFGFAVALDGPLLALFGQHRQFDLSLGTP